MRARRSVRMLVVVTGAIAAGCGGGGSSSSTPPSEAVVAGSYHYLLAGGQYGPPAAGLGEWGIAAASEAGDLDMTSVWQNADDIVSATSPFSLTWSIDTSNHFSVADVLGTLAQGGVAADGSLALSATSRGNTMPALLLWLRRSGTFTTASLTGTYHYLAHAAYAGTSWMLWGTMTFDGLGGYVEDVTSSLGGVQNGAVVYAGTYALGSDGTLTLDGNVQGGLREDGDVALLTYPTATLPYSTGGVGLAVLVRQSVGALLTDVTGTYALVGRRITASGSLQSVQFGQATVTLPGTLSIDYTTHEEGTVSPPAATTLNLTVAANGEVLVLGEDVAVGAASPDGRFLATVGGIEYGSDAQMVLLVR